MKKSGFNLGKLDVAKLAQFRDEVAAALNGKIALERRELESKIRTLAELQSGGANGGIRRARSAQRTSTRKNNKPSPLKGKTAAPKYRGPGGETWAGRGLAPRWLTALEKKGKKREAFLVQPKA